MQDDATPLMNGMIELEPIDDNSLQRRDMFKGAGTVAAWLAAANIAGAQTAQPGDKVPEAKAGALLPRVAFGSHQISRLIAGANPIYGYSHFNYVFSAHMGEYHTTERVLSFLRQLERAGLSTWQASWSERLETDWLRYKEEGGKLQLLLLSRPDFNDKPEMLQRAVKLKPMGHCSARRQHQPLLGTQANLNAASTTSSASATPVAWWVFRATIRLRSNTRKRSNGTSTTT